jgi:hypothetical protein
MPQSGQDGGDSAHYNPDGRRGVLQDAYTAVTEIFERERHLGEIHDNPAEYYRELRHLILMLGGFVKNLKGIPAPRKKQWDSIDLPLVNWVLKAVLADRVASEPMIQFSPRSHNDPVIYDLKIGSWVVSQCLAPDIRTAAEEVRRAYSINAYEAGVRRLNAGYLVIRDIASRYGAWDLTTPFRTTVSGYDRARRESAIADRKRRRAGSADEISGGDIVPELASGGVSADGNGGSGVDPYGGGDPT